MTPRERAQAHAIMYSQDRGRAKLFYLDGLEIVVQSCVFKERGEHGMLVCELVATRNGRFIPLDNPYMFVNPPTTNIRGRAGVQETFQRMIADAVLATEKRGL